MLSFRETDEGMAPLTEFPPLRFSGGRCDRMRVCVLCMLIMFLKGSEFYAAGRVGEQGSGK
jgi:hypothetical protein